MEDHLCNLPEPYSLLHWTKSHWYATFQPNLGLFEADKIWDTESNKDNAETTLRILIYCLIQCLSFCMPEEDPDWAETLHINKMLFKVKVKTVPGDREGNLPWFIHITSFMFIYGKIVLAFLNTVRTAEIFLNMWYILYTKPATVIHRDKV